MLLFDLLKQQLILLTIVIFTMVEAVSCNNANSNKTHTQILLQPDSIPSSDTTFSLFNDSNYFVTFKLLEKKISNDEMSLGNLILTNNSNNNVEILLNDTLEIFRPILQLKDFNNDGIKDILILHTSSARSNWTHHLYLVDNVNHKLKYVSDFEEITNPEFDSVNNIITSIALSGTNYYSFYRVDPNGKLIDLGNSFEDKGTSEYNLKYESAIKNILQQKKNN